MSFFENSFNELKSPLEMLLRRPGSDKRLMPKQLVLSSSVEFVFIDPTDNSELLLFQADSISKTKRFTEKKNFKPFGYSSNIVLTRDEGWDIRITGKKTDAILNAIIYSQEESLTGASNISPNFNNQAYPFAGLKPHFQIRERVLYLPDSKGTATAIEEYVYKNVSIVGFEESIEENASPITFNLLCYSAYRDIVLIPSEVETGALDTVSNIIDGLLKQNKQ